MVPPKLPPEILDEITQFSHQAAQLTLCRTSPVFRSLATRSLYRNVSLTTSSSLMQLCNTLRSNPVAAACVKRFSVFYLPMKPPNIAYTAYFTSFYQNLRTALLRLTNLQEFSLLVRDPTLMTTLFFPSAPALYFPLLRCFKTHLPLEQLLLSFLERHPKLAYLEVSHHENLVFDDPSHPRGNVTHVPRSFPTLRRLHHFVGNSVYLEKLTPAYPLPLRSAYVIWNATQQCQGPILSLASAASKTLNFLSCRRRGWNTDLVDLITMHLPNIHALHIHNVLIVDIQLPEGYQEEIAHYLSRCRNLQRLKLTREVQWCPNDFQHDLNCEFSIVTEWGSACPSLFVIILPHSFLHVEWHRVSENIWVPVDISSEGVARRWLKAPRIP
ncbi:hypothetical protein D9756_006899 [Leucocoprinus leucothites]|uniref:F-box domain-containing protein n=1 Tax=Leucocoprinus leucothites TaxID=201217 RepID=A0A8H5D5T0_9AGAR|nr:hypothetical protein D9756_006899 [Leucoagaricus leucothites]